jgi:hypothetical protein
MSGKELSEAEQEELKSHAADYLIKASFSTVEFSSTIKRILTVAHS